MSNSAAKESPSFPLSSLPDEVALSCLARVPRSDHLALSLVSKRYRSLVLSPEFYKMRSLLGRTEKCIYVCVSPHPNSTPLWFILRPENAAVNRRLMRPIPSFPFQPPRTSSVVALDWGIYVIGGFGLNEKPTSDVLLLDCRTNTWRLVPSMRVARFSPGAGVVDGKIYVFGGRPDDDSTNWGEVFDPKTQTWDTLVPLQDRSEKDGFIRESLVKEDKVYGVKWFAGSVYYSPSDGKWGRTDRPDLLSYCVVDKLLYGFDMSFGRVFWRESDESEWKIVKGLEALQMIFHGQFFGNSMFSKNISQVNSFGGNVVLFWLERSDDDGRLDVWCAEVSFERREEKREIWGTIEWKEAITTVDRAPFGPFGGDHNKVLYSATVNV
ncbi:unnamed protein product [Arabidopsis halleri]